eukprot:g75159.t1
MMMGIRTNVSKTEAKEMRSLKPRHFTEVKKMKFPKRGQFHDACAQHARLLLQGTTRQKCSAAYEHVSDWTLAITCFQSAATPSTSSSNPTPNPASSFSSLTKKTT